MNVVFLPFLSTRRTAPPDRSVGTAATVPPAHTDFACLRGRRVLVVVDDDNLRISLEGHGRRLCYERLLTTLRTMTDAVTGWAVMTCPADDDRRRLYLERLGWRALAVPRETVVTRRGAEVKGNADMDLCFECGRLVGAGQYDAVLVGSGDGDLCVSVARGIRRIAPGCRTVTLSVRESTSRRLRTRPDLFDGNILIGGDLTHSAAAGEGMP